MRDRDRRMACLTRILASVLRPQLALAILAGSVAIGCVPRYGDPTTSRAPDARRDAPLADLLLSATRRHEPGILRARGQTRYVWLLADGSGRIVRSAASLERPRSDVLRDVLRERFPDIDTDAWVRDVPEALFPVAGIYRLRSGEIGSDTVLVFWADPPVPVGGDPPRSRGPYRLGEAAAAQFSPPRVLRAAREAAPGQTVWYVESDEGVLLDVGVYHGGRDYDAIRVFLQPRFPGRTIQCSAGYALPAADGRLVQTVAVRLSAPVP